MRRLPTFLLITSLALLGLAATGCAPQSVLPFAAEIDDPDYRRGKELLRMGREADALKTFLKVIDQRGGAAAESHLEAGILYHKHIKDPISAIYHYRRYRELRPNTEQSRLVLQSIEACIREFARTLPAQPMDNQVDRTDMMDAIDRLQRENLQIKEQLTAARAAILDSSRPTAATGATAAGDGAFSLNSTPMAEPSQGGYAPGGTTSLEYSAPVGVVPVPTPTQPLILAPSTPAPAPRLAPSASTGQAPAPAASGVRRHVVAKGDTLQSISMRYYGTRSRFRDIYAANRDVMPNESTLRLGMELKIPQ